ncbi:endonuclease/exonuclease/phosphatase family protein [Clostridium fallax]|uniref:Predicted extracellular nuclease n=1 Tax=Clostridium fallax TaxID=1533 RepID=A0A1M4Z6D6_9CLOT|nr:endonuclease/exonuclease/phosphatase family protein [Clostridium fallax]SHF13550.1 Predicted extracellular nuclease [Clostridium fallax]SQB05870.1 cell wall binding repeat-containing protein [Clostridium fallax]
MSKNKIMALVTAAFMFASNTIVFAKPIQNKNIKAENTYVESSLKKDSKVENYVTILEAKDKAKGEEVNLKGTITSRIGNSFFLQDDTAGIYVYMGAKNLDELKLGNVVTFTGILDEYYGVKQIKNINNLKVVSENNNLPKAKVLKAEEVSNDKFLGDLITVENITITTVGKGKKGYNVIATDGTYNVNLRIDKWVNPYIDSKEFKVGTKINVTAPLTKHTDFNGETKYQLMISSLNNIKLSNNQDAQKVEVKKIPEIQGRAHRSPLENQNVSGVEGIVTTVSSKDKYQRGFYIQSEVPDNDPATSEGIFVETKDTKKVKVGDKVKVDGTVKELIHDYSPKTSTGLTETAIKATDFEVESSDNKLPEPININLEGNLLKNIDNDGLKDFEPEDDAIDYYESLEGMLVNVKDPLIVGADERYGELAVLASNGKNSKDSLTPNNGIKASEGDFNPEIITIDDVIIPISNKGGFIDKNMKVKVGDKLDGDVKGIMSYGFGKYKVLNSEKLPNIIPGNTKREVTTIEEKKDKLTIASYNIENFNNSDKNKVNGIARDIIENLKCPDIIGLVEVQDNSGDLDDGTTDASENFKSLIKAIKDQSKVEYDFVEIAPNNNEDGGKPGGNIRQGYLYRIHRVCLSNNKKGDAVTPVKVSANDNSRPFNENGLSINPGRIDPMNEAFKHSRKPLVCEFMFNGEKVVVIANHLGSKRGDQYLFGSIQPPQMKSEVSRIKQAKVINDFIKEIKEVNPKSNIVVLGDMNDFEFSDTIKTLEGNEMTDMINTLPVNERFTYVHNGNSQVLDHILVSNNLKDQAKFDIVNINSQFTKGYGRLSDHDPILVQLDLEANKNQDNNQNNEQNNEQSKEGWKSIDGHWYYLNSDGTFKTGWEFLNGDWYYFSNTGVMRTNWFNDGFNWYYLREGAMKNGWQFIDNNWYYLNSDGTLKTGWVYSCNKWYFLNSNGAMEKGWQSINGRWYYLGDNGVMATGWNFVSGSWYYLSRNGDMLINGIIDGWTIQGNGIASLL